MPGRPPKTYQYQTTDDPLAVASQFGTTPQDLINANPGGYPFATGQTINLPWQPATQWQPGGQASPIQAYANQAFSYSSNPNAGIRGRGPRPGGPTAPIGPVPSLGDVVRNVLGMQPVVKQPAYNADLGYGRSAGFGQVPDNVGNAEFYQEQLQRALSSPDKPVILSSAAMQSLGIDPAANGYSYQNGNWVLSTAANTATTTAGGQPQEQEIDPRNIAYTWNKYAKNPKSRFETNLKWAQNAWRRKRRAAKGHGSEAVQQPNQGLSDVTGFGLVNWGVGAG